MTRRQYVNYMDWNKATKTQNNYSDIYDYQRHNRGAFSASIGINKTSELAGWSRGKDLTQLRASLERIRDTAAELIDSIDPPKELSQPVQEKPAQKRRNARGKRNQPDRLSR